MAGGSSLFLFTSCYPSVHLSWRNRRANTSRANMASTLASSPILGLHTQYTFRIPKPVAK